MSNEYNEYLRNQKKQKEELDTKLKAEKAAMVKLHRSSLEHFDYEYKQKRQHLVASNTNDLHALEVSQNMQREALKEKLNNTKYEKTSKKRKIAEDEEEDEAASARSEKSYNLSQSEIQKAIKQYVESLSSNQQKTKFSKTIQSTPRAPMGDLTSSINRLGTPYNYKVQSASNQMGEAILLDLQCDSDSSKPSNSSQHNEESLLNNDLKFLEQYDSDLIEAIQDLVSDEEKTVIDTTIEPNE